MEQNENNGRTAIFLRLAPPLAPALDAAAAADGLSRAGWVRRLIAAGLTTRGDIASEPVSLPPSPPRRSSVIPPDDLVAVGQLAAAVGRTGGAVVQLCRALRENGHAAHAEAEAVLADLRVCQRDLSRVIERLA